jgi:cytosine permease
LQRALATIGVLNGVVVLGIIVPPIAAVYLTDFFVLRRQDYSDAGEGDSAVTNLNGLGACLIGAAVGLSMYYTHSSLTGVPTIESFLSASLTYGLAEQVRASHARDRMWRRAAALLR